ncbi:methyltransferase domain-containing protein [Catalinimonas sp. 4WD22]|uniref:class I SAM-dependent methyltransferase n=1 Tax=Catalinimonas locisalis TaxID=3133978 RepID=UPI003101407B
MRIPDESFVLHSWNQNARQWNTLIVENKLESRRLVTNKAIVEVLLSLKGELMLDVGCGEGWLVRKMNKEGIKCHGIDGSSELIQLAQQKGGGTYECISYGDIISGSTIEGSPFDVLVFNFAIFDEKATARLLLSLQTHLLDGGKIVIQSLHPDAMPASKKSRWEADVWQGLPGDFKDTYAWYLRSMEDWKALFDACEYKLEKIIEPKHPQSQQAVSVIFVLSLA